MKRTNIRVEGEYSLLNNGFTLIELLAVIVILAIIALIATPIILNIIGNSKKSAVLRSGELYLGAVETAIARENLNSQFNPISCVIGVDGNLTCVDKDSNETKLTVEVNGSKPTAGTIEITNGKIIKVTGMILDGKELKKENGKVTVVGDSTSDPVVPPVSEDYKDTTGAVVDLPTGLIPVIYLDNTWKVADTTTKWYDYAQQEWANAVILNAGVTKNIGDTIDVSSEIKGMFVYVPRYEYKIEGQYGTHIDGTAGTKEQPGEIKVNFISKETIIASEGYRVHPAFTFGTSELNGIWVGKFETTGDAAAPTVLPNVASLRNQNVSTQFATAQKFNTYVNNSNIDAHMAKNSEWGAVAYLSQSKYGKYGNSNYVGSEKQVMINNCSNYITGIGADSQNATPLASTCISNTYETIKGQAASTTGNITGVYDMSGGSDEYVMGVYSKIVGNGGINIWPNEKYYDNYTTDIPATACNEKVCYGHALSETSGWFGDYNVFTSSSTPWFLRGGRSNSSVGAGIFYFGYGNGSTYSNVSFRIIMIED